MSKHFAILWIGQSGQTATCWDQSKCSKRGLPLRQESKVLASARLNNDWGDISDILDVSERLSKSCIQEAYRLAQITWSRWPGKRSTRTDDSQDCQGHSPLFNLKTAKQRIWLLSSGHKSSLRRLPATEGEGWGALLWTARRSVSENIFLEQMWVCVLVCLSLVCVYAFVQAHEETDSIHTACTYFGRQECSSLVCHGTNPRWMRLESWSLAVLPFWKNLTGPTFLADTTRASESCVYKGYQRLYCSYKCKMRMTCGLADVFLYNSIYQCLFTLLGAYRGGP